MYTYDSLNRLSSATANNWGLSFGYDEFGNRTSQTGSGGAPTMNLAYDTTNYTNRITTTGFSYDNVGNLTQMLSEARDKS